MSTAMERQHSDQRQDGMEQLKECPYELGFVNFP